MTGKFGARLEDDMHITEDGVHWCASLSPSIGQPFGPAACRKQPAI